MTFDASQYQVRSVPLAEARPFIQRHHYAGGSANTAVFAHGLYRRPLGDCELLGVALWMPPTKVCAQSVVGEAIAPCMCPCRRARVGFGSDVLRPAPESRAQSGERETMRLVLFTSSFRLSGARGGEESPNIDHLEDGGRTLCGRAGWVTDEGEAPEGHEPGCLRCARIVQRRAKQVEP